MKSILTAIFFLSLLAACSNTQPGPDDSLYRQLGGDIGIDQLVVTSIQLLHRNRRVAILFEDIDQANLVIQLTDQLCALTGGPCEYDGLSMQDAHAGMDLSKAEFDVFVEVFITAMNAENIPFAIQNNLLAKLAPMRADIIGQ